MNVSELMTRDVDAARPDSSVESVAGKMKEHDCGSIPVCDERNRPLGIVTDRDIVIRAVASGRDLAATRADEVMTHDTVSCSPDDDVSRAEDLMRRHQIRRLLVVDQGGSLVGLLPMAKVARAADECDVGGVIKEVSQPTHRDPGHTETKAV